MPVVAGCLVNMIDETACLSMHDDTMIIMSIHLPLPMKSLKVDIN